MRQAVAVAAKAPQPGRVKTRLVPDLTPDEAAELYTCFLKDTLELVESVPRIGIFISYQPLNPGAHAYWPFADRYPALEQRGHDLGERIYHAIEDVLAAGYDSACIVGSDSPNLPRAYLELALGALRLPGNRVVFGPATDGGYYLIGAKTVSRRLFEEINWSSDQVLQQTVQRALELEIDVSLLPECYDVDTIADLDRLICDLTIAGSQLQSGDGPGTVRNTRQYLMSRRSPNSRLME
jgi:rSAM/selenodomain-associated transferase 1